MKVWVVTIKWSSDRTMRDYSEVYGVYASHDKAISVVEEAIKSMEEELDGYSWINDVTIDECNVIM